jgi:hypothetical protein
MPDFADIASDRELLDTSLAVAAARAVVPDAPQPCGLCHNCLEAVPHGYAFCDQDCRDDWQLRKARGG